MINILITLFLSFWQIGSFSIGGGYAIMPLIQDQMVDKYGWLTIQEFTDIITISQMTPGPLSINASTFVGLRVAGIIGAIIANTFILKKKLAINDKGTKRDNNKFFSLNTSPLISITRSTIVAATPASIPLRTAEIIILLLNAS